MPHAHSTNSLGVIKVLEIKGIWNKASEKNTLKMKSLGK